MLHPEAIEHDGGPTLEDIYGPVIHSYTRAQAIEDGALVELDADLAREAGIVLPVAVTARMYAECIDLTVAAKRAYNDVAGRMWDVFTVLRHGINNAKPGDDRLLFELHVVRDRMEPTRTTLKAVVGPGDDAEPVITIMFPDED